MTADKDLIIWNDRPTMEDLLSASEEGKIVVAHMHPDSDRADEWVKHIGSLSLSNYLCAWYHPYNTEDFREWFLERLDKSTEKWDLWFAPAGKARGKFKLVE